jgi:hypothetical protein
LNTPVKTCATAVAAVAFALAMAACASDETPAASSSTANSSSTSSAPSSSAAEAAAPPAVHNESIADYIKQNGITETPVHRGDAGSPTLDLPVPDGWVDAGDQAPPYAWNAIIFAADEAAAANPPTIVSIMSKLTGNVDPAQLLQFAPGELKNLPGWEGGDGKKTQLSGFDAYEIGGSYVRDGQKRMIAQKTVVIPSGSDVYVLQLNADGLEDQIRPLMEATAQIDKNAKITP